MYSLSPLAFHNWLLSLMLLDIIAEITTVQVRRLRQGEALPSRLFVGFANLDRNWTWVQTENGDIKAVLLACPCHGMVQIVRLVGTVSPRLLRAFIRDCHAAGYSGVIAWLDPNDETGARILRVFKEAGAIVDDRLHLCVGVSLDKLREW